MPFLRFHAVEKSRLDLVGERLISEIVRTLRDRRAGGDEFLFCHGRKSVISLSFREGGVF